MDNNICQVYEDEIQLLEGEIKLLTEKYEDIQQESTFFSDEEILMSINSLQKEFQGEFKGNESPSDLKARLGSLETDLSFLMKFTGIQFRSHSKKTVEKTGNRTVQKHRLSGNCHSLFFQLEFQLLEMRNKESVSAVITDLNIVMESGENSDVSKFVSSAGEHGNLLRFFRSLSSYAEWCEHRRCTFLHFKVVSIKPLYISIMWSSLNSSLRQSNGCEISTLYQSMGILILYLVEKRMPLLGICLDFYHAIPLMWGKIKNIYAFLWRSKTVFHWYYISF